ncbi:sterol 3-beta-glucosyltransferase UGT80A2-like protein isoform X1 [Cinnamomum micranthum f. kanehirae]|uniref:sterol 3beta-glucosyltransferase n=1 Tax=Cinnamomum micranthum f. kanehirae TaxID=337451 RepID=A0A443PZC6_9MAGN|nr:sterol 3-beta-glucosyltransferase UGT80A2-like protein isoform X1 [Cinnamomum micranthum f. kanehirae]
MATEKGKEASLDLDLQKRMGREGDRSSDLDSDLDSDLSIEEALEKPKKNKSSSGSGSGAGAGDGDGESTKMKVEVESGPARRSLKVEQNQRRDSRPNRPRKLRLVLALPVKMKSLQKFHKTSIFSPGLIDRSLPRANTLPGDKADVDKLEPSSSQSQLERSKTERRIQNNIADEAAQIFDDKISARKKLKMLNRIATVKHDGTVEFNLPSTVEPESLRFGSKDTYNEAVDEEPLDSTDLTCIPPLQIVMLIVGTRGDVQPFIAIGKRLQDYGHRVRLSTHSNFKDFVLTAGLEFFPIGGDPKILAEYMVKNKGFLPSGPSEIPTQRKQMKEIIYSLLSACNDPDAETGIPFKAEAIIANPPAYGHAHVAEALKVPLHIFFTMPWTPTSEFPHPLSRVKQSAGYRLSYQIVDSLIWLGIRDMINDFRKKKLKLRPVTYLSGAQGSASDVPTGYIWSPHLVPKPKDWGPKVDVVGFCFLDLASNYEPPESLVKWIEAGSKPIYIGFGSLPVQEPKKMTQIIVEALEITGQRGIINKGWGGLGQLAEPKDFVYLLDNCPHDWLFLHCMAVVHHGGAGTTAAGLKAACPTTVVPFFGDQPFWGEQVHARGVGPAPIPVDQFSLDKLVNAIRYMLDPKVKERALELAAAMETEDGVTGAVKAFFKHLPPRNPPTQPSPVPTGFFEPCFGSVRKCFGCS